MSNFDQVVFQKQYQDKMTNWYYAAGHNNSDMYNYRLSSDQLNEAKKLHDQGYNYSEIIHKLTENFLF